MLKIFVLILALVSIPRAYSQENNKNLDLIIVIDESVSVNTISNFKIRVTSSNTEDIIASSYYPGNLVLKQTDYAKMMTDTARTILLEFDYNEYVNNKHLTYHYSIEFKKSWFRELFNILRIYNLDKKKYKKKFKSIDTSQKYIYEMDSPGGTFRYVR
ncbi:hypothetical protein [Longitalea luteola]|uniref:hypothetical protein n=1 Tax=Longitalea luteola TaxID=2812563 RepID=UPI001A964B16|nr:hypothetical protein [Longitalea luteola]